MDIIHHTLIGGTGFVLASAADQSLLGIVFIAASVFPDLDVFFIVFGKRFYLRNHQGITHSLLLAPLFAVLLCLPLIWLLKLEWSWLLFLAALSGIILHIILDWFNTFSIELFSPFFTQRYSLDAVFFIDSVALLLTIAFYPLYIYFDIKIIAYLYPLLFSGYFIIKLYLHNKVVKHLNPLYAIPSSLNPFEFYILEQTDMSLCSYLYNTFNHHKHGIQYYPSVDPKYQKLAETSTVFCDMRDITRALQITEIKQVDNGIIITANDLAIRNFGGKFAKTTLKFDHQGKLTDEMANI
ncbi:MAG: metal-dependent hydrolase [gamma proteobacterium symbiont of Taylorina sp.]|nr:metal-dependent hydrolase [gamma proteobacterium symbiont of Taylorina sp.]